MARSIHFEASWLHHESDGAANATASGSIPGPAPIPRSAVTRPPVEAGVAVRAEEAVVSELLQIARTVLTLEITFEAGPERPVATPVPAGAARFDRPIVLRDGQVYGTLCCVSDDRRTPVGSRPADALRCVAVLVGKELDRHRRKLC